MHNPSLDSTVLRPALVDGGLACPALRSLLSQPLPDLLPDGGARVKGPEARHTSTDKHVEETSQHEKVSSLVAWSTTSSLERISSATPECSVTSLMTSEM
jgi:hypothetical protein